MQHLGFQIYIFGLFIDPNSKIQIYFSFYCICHYPMFFVIFSKRKKKYFINIPAEVLQLNSNYLHSFLNWLDFSVDFLWLPPLQKIIFLLKASSFVLNLYKKMFQLLSMFEFLKIPKLFLISIIFYYLYFSKMLHIMIYSLCVSLKIKFTFLIHWYRKINVLYHCNMNTDNMYLNKSILVDLTNFFRN